MSEHAERERYRPSGRVDAAASALPVAVVATAGACWAAALAEVLDSGFYIAGLFLILHAVVPVLFGEWAVLRARCRNPGVAAAAGAAFGVASFLAFYQCDLWFRWDVPPWAVGRLPGFVAHRVETDRVVRVGHVFALRPAPPAAGVRPERPLATAPWVGVNGALFATGLALMAVWPAARCAAAAGRPFDEYAGRWHGVETLTLAPEAAADLERSIAGGSVREWVEAGPRRVSRHEAHAVANVYSNPAGADAPPDAVGVYARVGRGPIWRLTPAEVGALTVLLPDLGDALPPRPGQRDAAPPTRDPLSARILPLPPALAGQVDTPWNRAVGFAWFLVLASVPGPLAAAAVIGGTGHVHRLAIIQKALPGWVPVVYVITSAVLCLAFIGWWYNPNGPACMAVWHRFHSRRMRRAVADRPDPLVAAGDRRAAYAEMQPRRIWRRGNGRDRCNAGLFLADAGRGRLMFEGDHESYDIPAAAVLAAELEPTSGGAVTMGTLFAVVLRVRVGEEAQELPFLPYADIDGANSWLRANALLDRIEAACGRAFERPAAPPPARWDG